MPLLYLSGSTVSIVSLDEFLGNMVTTSVKEAQSDSVSPAKLHRKEMDVKLRVCITFSLKRFGKIRGKYCCAGKVLLCLQ